MKICMIVGRADPDNTLHCGIGDYASHLAQMLASADHEVTLMTAPVTSTGDDVQSTVKRILIENWGIGTGRLLHRLVASSQPDIVHLQYQPDLFQRSAWVPLYPLVVRQARTGAAFVTTFHSVRHPSPISLTRPYAQALLRWSDGIVITNAWHREQALRLYPAASSKLELIPVGTNISLKPITRERQIWLRQGLQIPEEALVLVNFGFPREDKGLCAVIESLASLRQNGVPAYFVHIGEIRPVDQTHVAALRQFANQLEVSSYIRWLGALPEDEVSAYLQIADVYIAPYTDGFSPRRTSTIVALFHGLAVLTTRGDHGSEELSAQAAAVLVPQDDTGALSTKLFQLARDPAWRMRLGRNAHKVALRYDWEQITAMHESFYHRIEGTARGKLQP
jgi:glycosyltransferase involved in cell wall biosynthesis